MSERVEGIQISRDDIDFLIELFHHDVGQPVISDDHFEFDSLDEFIENRGIKPALLRIESTMHEGGYRHISAEFEGNRVFLHASRNAPFHEVKEFLHSKQPWSYRVLNPWLLFMLLIICANVLNGIVNIAKINKQDFPEWTVYSLGILLAIALGGFIYRGFNFGLRLTRRHEGGFWKRNAEKIALTTIGAIIGAAVVWASNILGSN